MAVVLETNVDYPKKKGKVRDVYDLGDRILMVATDRISAFDVVLPNGIPGKGACLNGLSNYWFGKTRKIIDNHVLIPDFRKFPEELKKHAELEGRSVIVKKTEPLPAECVVRGYISGSAWNSYKEGKDICGIRLRTGLRESDKLDEPIFTPSTKATSGHDENIPFGRMAEIIGKDLAEEIREKSIAIYESAAKAAEKKGIIIADTKFEFGRFGDRTIIIDELLTPDSSRFWPADSYEPGRGQKSFDKQYVRDYLLSIKWDKQPPAPMLPDEIVTNTSRKYQEAYEKITGNRLAF